MMPHEHITHYIKSGYNSRTGDIIILPSGGGVGVLSIRIGDFTYVWVEVVAVGATYFKRDVVKKLRLKYNSNVTPVAVFSTKETFFEYASKSSDFTLREIVKIISDINKSKEMAEKFKYMQEMSKLVNAISLYD